MFHARTTTRTAAALVAATVAAAALAMAARPAGAEVNASFSLEPAPGAAAAAEGWFDVVVTPGSSTVQHVRVANIGAAAATIRLAAVPVSAGQNGGVAYGDSVGSAIPWIRMEREVITLAAGSDELVPFTIELPAGSRTGEHVAGVVAEATTPREATTVQAGSGVRAALDLRVRRAVAVVARVPGPAVARLEVTDVRAVVRPDGVHLELSIANRGTAMTKGSGTVTVVGSNFTAPVDFDTLPPDATMAYPVAWTSEPRSGRHRVEVEMEYTTMLGASTTDLLRWSGDVIVGDEHQRELADRAVAQPSILHEAGDVAGGLPPLVQAALGATASFSLGSTIWALWRWRRRRASAE